MLYFDKVRQFVLDLLKHAEAVTVVLDGAAPEEKDATIKDRDKQKMKAVKEGETIYKPPMLSVVATEVWTVELWPFCVRDESHTTNFILQSLFPLAGSA